MLIFLIDILISNLNKTSLRGALSYSNEQSNYWGFFTPQYWICNRNQILIGLFHLPEISDPPSRRKTKSCIILYSLCLAEFKTIGLLRNLYPFQRHAIFSDLICFTVRACLFEILFLTNIAELRSVFCVISFAAQKI